MEPVSLVKQISQLIEAHEVPYHLENDWVVPFGKLPAIRATWLPREHNGVLEVEVLLEGGAIVNECFAGIGSGKKGMLDAIENFSVNSLHVLLAAFWESNDPEQVTTETWEVSGKLYTAYIGNFGTRGGDEVSPDVPVGLFGSIENSIKKEPLKNDNHWVRHFFCDAHGDQTFEVLLNNEVWESGLRSMKSLPWKTTNGYYSVRNFMVLRAIA